jgi:hypothetical protein
MRELTTTAVYSRCSVLVAMDDSMSGSPGDKDVPKNNDFDNDSSSCSSNNKRPVNSSTTRNFLASDVDNESNSSADDNPPVDSKDMHNSGASSNGDYHPVDKRDMNNYDSSSNCSGEDGDKTNYFDNDSSSFSSSNKRPVNSSTDMYFSGDSDVDDESNSSANDIPPVDSKDMHNSGASSNGDYHPVEKMDMHNSDSSYYCSSEDSDKSFPKYKRSKAFKRKIVSSSESEDDEDLDGVVKIVDVANLDVFPMNDDENLENEQDVEDEDVDSSSDQHPSNANVDVSRNDNRVIDPLSPASQVVLAPENDNSIVKLCQQVFAKFPDNQRYYKGWIVGFGTRKTTFKVQTVTRALPGSDVSRKIYEIYE